MSVRIGSYSIDPVDNVLESELISCPAVCATPLSALEREHISTQDHFVRDHYPVPGAGWSTASVEVAGAVGRPIRFSVTELHALPRRRRDVVLECAGHRRNELEPKPPVEFSVAPAPGRRESRRRVARMA